MYAYSAPHARYTFKQLTGHALDQVQHFVSKETRSLNCADLNTFPEPVKMTYDDTDQLRSVASVM